MRHEKATLTHDLPAEEREALKLARVGRYREIVMIRAKDGSLATSVSPAIAAAGARSRALQLLAKRADPSPSSAQIAADSRQRALDLLRRK